MTGTVTPQLDIMIPLRLRGPSGIHAHVQAVIDTGFNDHLTLSQHVIDALVLPVSTKATYVLADGSRSNFTLYEVEIEWFGQWKLIRIVPIENNALIGTNLLLGTRITVDMVEGGRVEIEPVPHM